MQSRVRGEVGLVVIFHGALAHAGLVTAEAASIFRFEDAFAPVWLRDLADFICVQVALASIRVLA